MSILSQFVNFLKENVSLERTDAQAEGPSYSWFKNVLAVKVKICNYSSVVTIQVYAGLPTDGLVGIRLVWGSV